MTLRSGELITIPSPIDVHVHLREPGGEDKETITSGTHAAVSGGYQAVFDMPNNPGGNETWSVDRLDQKVAIAQRDALTDIGFYGGIDLANPNLHQVSQLATRAAGLKLYMGRTTGNTAEYGLDEARPIVDTWIYHARNAGLSSPILLHAREEIGAETAKYIAWHEFPVHWCHISSETEVNMVERLDRRYGHFFSSGVTPHHLLMTSRNADYQQGWNGARMMPPLRQEVDAEKLFYAYKTGLIKILETDHAPHTLDDKLAAETANPAQEQPHEDDCYGVSGIEFVLPVMLQRVRLGQLSLDRLVDSLHTQPMRMLNQRGARFDGTTQLQIEPHVISERHLAGKSRNTPYLNWTGGALVKAVKRGGVTYRPSTYRELRGKATIMQPKGDNL